MLPAKDVGHRELLPRQQLEGLTRKLAFAVTQELLEEGDVAFGIVAVKDEAVIVEQVKELLASELNVLR